MSRALVVAALGLASGCAPDVTVGENGSAASIADGGLLAARYDAAASRVVAAGHGGCADPSDDACDAWLAEIPAGASDPVGLALMSSDARDVARALSLLDADSTLFAGVTASEGTPRAFAARDQGGIVWSTAELSLADASEAVAVEVAPSGEIAVVGNELSPLGTEDGFAALLDADGAILGRLSLAGGPAANTVIASVTTSSLNHVFVGGVRYRSEDRSEPGVPVVVQLSPELEVWNSRAGLELPGVTSGNVTGIFDPDHEILLCGSADGQALVARMEETLTLIDSVLIPGEVGAVEVRGCAYTDDGALVLVGSDGGQPWLGKVERLTLEVIFTRRPAPSSLSLWAVAGTTDGAAVAVGRDALRGVPIALPVEP